MMMDDVADFSNTDPMLHTPVANGLASTRTARRSTTSLHAFSPVGDPDRPRPFGSNPFTLDEKIKIAYDLSRKLPPDCISSRSGGAAGRVTYLEGWKAIALANEIFGFNGWATQVLDQHIDFMDPGQTRAGRSGLTVRCASRCVTGRFARTSALACARIRAPAGKLWKKPGRKRRPTRSSARFVTSATPSATVSTTRTSFAKSRACRIRRRNRSWPTTCTARIQSRPDRP
ncbi:recombination protein rad52, variant [Allomyces macrogynus ATCC 38327]|uniref:Recombination protein rad52, variant n=1 Tax=Allomyces macrogynus (strain ATCC 38327) TaxID=578462 RepID=A0A0L0T3L3_ALLM3|nr:recombination protein rad52, variant [Allomyces macrogynus ATCC 38327]|eukprot:KNE69327.1 recombination protein rad52, variant [Allomyces macrogynus ATCC 38327]